MKRWKVLPVVRCVLQILVFPVLIGQILGGKDGYVYLCVLTLVLMALPEWAEKKLAVTVPEPMQILILLFVFFSEILGEIKGCYVRYPWWDILLHGVSGFLFASFGYGLPLFFGRQESASIGFRVAFSICFSVTVGVLWEFLEWGADLLFGLDMQKDTVITAIRSVCLSPRGANSVEGIRDIRNTVLILSDGGIRVMEGYLDVGLQDTMGDLLVDLGGAAVFGLLSRWERLRPKITMGISQTGER